MANGVQGPKKRVPKPTKEELAALDRPSTNTDSGTKEAQQFSEGLSEEQIKAEAAANEHGRNEQFRDHFEIIAVIGLWLGAILLFAMLGTLVFHFVAKESWLWLTDKQLDKLQYLATGGLVTGIVSTHIKKRLGGD